MAPWFPKAVKHLKKNDPILAKIIEGVGPCTLKKRQGYYRALVRAIIAQQISTSAARAIQKRLLIALNKRVMPSDFLKLNEADVRKIGLSPQKYAYIHDLSKKLHHKELRLKGISNWENEQIISELVKIKGIGRWTAEMFLIFSLKRPDVLALDDFGIKKGMMIAYGLGSMPSKDQMIAISEKWKPYRSIGSWYMWRVLEN